PTACPSPRAGTTWFVSTDRAKRSWRIVGRFPSPHRSSSCGRSSRAPKPSRLPSARNARFELDLEHELGQRQALDLEPGTRRELLRVDRSAVTRELEELRHVRREDVLDDDVVERAAVVREDLAEVGVDVLHLLRE